MRKLLKWDNGEPEPSDVQIFIEISSFSCNSVALARMIPALMLQEQKHRLTHAAGMLLWPQDGATNNRELAF